MIKEKLQTFFGWLDGRNGLDLLLFFAIILILWGVAMLVETAYRKRRIERYMSWRREHLRRYKENRDA